MGIRHSSYIPRSIRFCKRSMDIFGALIGLSVLLPLLPVIALAIKLDSRGPVFFSQRRLGISRAQVASTFMVHKFRTMVTDAERHSGPVLAQQNDPRITRVGHLLRRTRLDELPQFWNVLVGEMSLVGPRPERPELAQELDNRYPLFNERTDEVKPGITGFAQVEMSYQQAADQVYGKMAYDYAYSAALTSFWAWLKMDCWIIAKTISVAITGKGQ